MKKLSPSLSPKQITAICGGEYRGSGDLLISSLADPSEANSTSAVCVEQEKYFPAVESCAAGLVFCAPTMATRLPERNLLLHPHPYFALMRLASWWLEQDAAQEEPFIHPTAVIDPSAQLGEGVSIGAFSTVGKNCVLRDHVRIGESCVLGNGVMLGSKTRLYSRVTIYQECELGENCIIHSGAVIGADGFGFALMEGIQQKIPQIGIARLGNYVEVGANTTIDRGTLGPTLIGDGTKIDNLVQIGHNCRIGKHSIICAQTGLAGSTIIGDYVYLAGQVGTAGHITIGDRTKVGGQSGVTHDLPEDSTVLGFPAWDATEFRRMIASQRHLPEIYRHYKQQIKNTPDKG